MISKRRSGASSTPGWPKAGALMPCCPVAGPSAPTARCTRRGWPVSAAGSMAMTVAIVDYGSGNLHSAPRRSNARRARVGGPGRPACVTGDPDRCAAPIAWCCRGSALCGLSPRARCAARHGRGAQRNGAPQGSRSSVFASAAIDGRARSRIRGGRRPGLDRRRGRSHRAGGPELKIPHMGWNTLATAAASPAAGIPLGPRGLHAYFVHSYQLKVEDRADLVAEADYGGPYGRRRRANLCGHPIPSRRRVSAWPRPDRQFPEVEAVIPFPRSISRTASRASRAGRHGARHRVQSRPGSQARVREQGFEYLHIVDLDGAFAGKPMNAPAPSTASWSRRSRSSSAAASATWRPWKGVAGEGRARVIIGTAAVRDPISSEAGARDIPGDRGRGSMRARWQGGGARLAETSELFGARHRPPLRGRRRRGDHLHRCLARRHAHRPQSRRHHCAGGGRLHSGDRLGRARSR